MTSAWPPAAAKCNGVASSSGRPVEMSSFSSFSLAPLERNAPMAFCTMSVRPNVAACSSTENSSVESEDGERWCDDMAGAQFLMQNATPWTAR